MSGTIPMTGEEYDSLHAEAEALRAALLGIASVNPAERGIEWAKSYASDGLKGAGSELYARWLETFKEAEALRAENEAYAKNLRGKHSLAGATYELLIRERDQLRTELEAARSALAGDGRDEFEAMYRSQHRNITRDDRPDPPLAWGYANSLTHDRWCGWAAAWKRARALVADRRTNQGGEA